MARYAVCLLMLQFTASMAMSMDEPEQKAKAAKESNDMQAIEVQGGSADDILVIARVFPNTFRIAQEAEIRLTFSKSDKFIIDADLLEIGISLQQKSGWFQISGNIYPLSKALAEGYIWKNDASSVSINADPSYPSPGPAQLSISIVLRKSLPPPPGAVASYGPALKTITCPTVHLEILAGTKAWIHTQ
jgi:hypothetical protein